MHFCGCSCHGNPHIGHKDLRQVGVDQAFDQKPRRARSLGVIDILVSVYPKSADRTEQPARRCLATVMCHIPEHNRPIAM